MVFYSGNNTFMFALVVLIMWVLVKKPVLPVGITPTPSTNPPPVIDMCSNPVNIDSCTDKMYIALALNIPFDDYANTQEYVKNQIGFLISVALNIPMQQVYVQDFTAVSTYTQVHILLLLPPGEKQTIVDRINAIFSVPPVTPVTDINPFLMTLCTKLTFDQNGNVSGTTSGLINGTCTGSIVGNLRSQTPNQNFQLPLREKAGFSADSNSDLMKTIVRMNYPITKVWWLVAP